jgi:hypothetical protein
MKNDVSDCNNPIRCLPEDAVCNNLAQEQAAYCASQGEIIGSETVDDGMAYTGGAIEDALLITGVVGITFLIPLGAIALFEIIRGRLRKR